MELFVRNLDNIEMQVGTDGKLCIVQAERLSDKLIDTYAVRPGIIKLAAKIIKVI